MDLVDQCVGVLAGLVEVGGIGVHDRLAGLVPPAAERFDVLLAERLQEEMLGRRGQAPEVVAHDPRRDERPVGAQVLVEIVDRLGRGDAVVGPGDLVQPVQEDQALAQPEPEPERVDQGTAAHFAEVVLDVGEHGLVALAPVVEERDGHDDGEEPRGHGRVALAHGRFGQGQAAREPLDERGLAAAGPAQEHAPARLGQDAVDGYRLARVPALGEPVRRERVLLLQLPFQALALVGLGREKPVSEVALGGRVAVVGAFRAGSQVDEHRVQVDRDPPDVLGDAPEVEVAELPGGVGQVHPLGEGEHFAVELLRGDRDVLLLEG